MATNTHDNDALNKLEYLHSSSKSTPTLETHLSFGDRVLAEFIVDLGRSCHTVVEFDAKLTQNGTVLPDYFVCTLLNTIHAILPLEPKKEEAPMPYEEHMKSTLSTLKTESDLNDNVDDGEGLRLKLKSLCFKMDALGFWRFVIGKKKELEVLRAQILAALTHCVDPTRFVIEKNKEFGEEHCSLGKNIVVLTLFQFC